jgi:hypothetical protein
VLPEARWRGGISSWNDYLHSKGMQAGFYTDYGVSLCTCSVAVVGVGGAGLVHATGCWVLGVGCWVLGVSFWGSRLDCSCSQRRYNSHALACTTPMLVDTIPHIEHPPATMQPRVRQVHGCCACAWQTNSSFGDANHIDADMLQLASEGVDYIKVRCYFHCLVQPSHCHSKLVSVRSHHCNVAPC